MNQHNTTQNGTSTPHGFVLNHTMLRIKNPKVSLDFYTHIMGMQLLRKLDFEEMQFSLYFLHASAQTPPPPDDEPGRTLYAFSQPGVLELTHNWGTEDDPECKYHDGNQQPQGFGHICFSVPDLDVAIAWLDDHNVSYIKRLDQGKMKDIAFIRDPDGYWIEILQPDRLAVLGKSGENT